MLLLVTMLTAQTAWADNVNYYDPTAAEGQQNKTATNPTAITSSTQSLGSSGSTTWYYVSGTVSNNNRINVQGTVNIILVDGCTFTATTGIHVVDGNTLNIYAQKAGSGCGTLIAQTNGKDASIGGNGGGDSWGGTADSGESSGTITIYGGNITTTGNIGGGNGGIGNDWEDIGQEDPDNPGVFLGGGGTNPGDGGNGGTGTVNIYGGVITVGGSIGGGRGGDGTGCSGENGGGTVSLTWTNSSDGYKANQYYGAVTLVKAFEGFPSGVYENGELYDNVNYDINGTMLDPVGTIFYVTLDGSYDPACLSLNMSRAKAGDEISLTAINGYTVSSVTVTDADNGSVSVTDNHNGTWTFTMPAKAVTITATASHTHYEIATAYDVNLNVNGNDILVQGSKTYYRAGATIPFTLIPFDENYELSGLNVYHTDDESVSITPSLSGSTYSFTMPAADVTISPSWLQTSFSIYKDGNMSLSISDGGTVTINSHVYYIQGATITVTVTPPSEKCVSSFSVKKTEDDSNVDYTKNIDGTYTFTMPGADVKLSANYEIDYPGMVCLEGTAAFTVTDGISGVDDLYTASPRSIYYNTNNEDRAEGCTRLFDGKYSSTDNSNYSKWCVGGFTVDDYNGAYFNTGNPLFVEFNTAQPVIPKKYMLITGNDNQSYNGRNPRNWKILAKVNASDTNWETIADITDDNTMQDNNFTAYTFDFNNPNDKTYQYFRFEITGTQGIPDLYGVYETSYDIMQLSEMKMWVKNAEHLTMNSAGIMTYASKEALDFSKVTPETDGATLTAYIVSNFDGDNSTLTLTTAGAVPAGTGLLLKGTANAQFTVPVATSATAPATIYLVGVTDGTTSVPVTTDTNTNFILANGTHGINWYTLSTSGAIGANKAYLSLPTDQLNLSNSAPGFTWVYDDGVTTPLLSPEGEDGGLVGVSWYTLDGRKLSGKPTTKGLYIHNGRKTVIK